MTATTQAEPQQRLRMPKVWRGRRRFLLVTLVVLGVIQAVLALTMALVVDGLLSAVPLTSGTPSVPDPPWARLVGLAAAVLGIGLARWVGRVVAEDIGRVYGVGRRRRWTGAGFRGFVTRSLGVVVARASNDLTAVRNWIAQGLVPMLTALPLIAVVLGALVFINPPVAVAVAVPL